MKLIKKCTICKEKATLSTKVEMMLCDNHHFNDVYLETQKVKNAGTKLRIKVFGAINQQQLADAFNDYDKEIGLGVVNTHAQHSAESVH